MADQEMDTEEPAQSKELQVPESEDKTPANLLRKHGEIESEPAKPANTELINNLEKDEQNSAKTELGKKLEEFALKPEKWLPRFQHVLGVDNINALQFLGTDDYLNIEKHTEAHWEKIALRKLLNIEDPQTTKKKLVESQAVKRKENQAKAKTGLEEMNKVITETKTKTDEVVKSEVESLQKDKDKSVKTSKALEGIVEQMHKGLSSSGGPLPNVANLSDEELLYHASGGLALEGIYMTKKQDDVLLKREILLDVPSGIALAGPLQKPVLEQKEFSSSEDESRFRQSMEKLGFSITTAAKGGFLGFQAEASFGYSSTSMSKQKSESHTEHCYISTTKYYYIPLASCYIPYEKLHLSPAALEELQSTEKLLEHCDKMERPSLKERYKTFFIRFGSHANQGPVHFGGIYWWKASSQGFKHEMLEKVKEETANAVNASVDGSYSGLFSATVGTDVTKTDSKASSTKHESNKLEKKIELSVTKTGGPPTVDTLNEWKAGLQANNKTWWVIDRGVHLIPVWNIILSNHKEDFKNVHQVAKDLIEIYESCTGLRHNLPIGENVSTAVHEANSFLAQMHSWQVHPTQQQVKKLMDFRQYLNEKTGNYHVWLNVCLPHKELIGFLGRVLEFYTQSPREDESIIRCMLKCLLQNIECSFDIKDSYALIMKWIYQPKTEQRVLDISDFSDFIDLMSQVNNNLQFHSTDNVDEDIQESRTKLSVIINSYLQSFLKTLKSMEQKEEELLVLCAARSIGYSIQNHCFQQSLGWQEVNILIERMQNVFKEYRNLKDCKDYRRQAFLLVSGLTLSDDDGRSRSTAQKREFLHFMLENIRNTLQPEIVSVLQKHSEPFDLESLISDLNHLCLGSFEAIANNTTESLVNKLKSVILTPSEPDDQPAITSVATTSYSQNVQWLMEKLGLEKNYPKGLNRRNFHVVHKPLKNQPEKETELPNLFMQMLMSLDYRFRYLVCKNVNVMDNAVNLENPEDQISTFDTVDDLFDFCSKEEAHTIQTESTVIHPMDLLLAVYHCSDDMMRQYIFTKLSVCQFALPLIVPRPYDSLIEIPLWAFRQVCKSILDTDVSGAMKHKETLICQSDFPIICFTRFGTSPFSKSEILDNMLSKHKHGIFFHRNSEGSVKNRVLVDGLAEIFWYCPSGKDSDQFQTCTAFVNLHGDAWTYTKQAEFLQEISSINVVLFSKSGQQGQDNELLKRLKEKPLIILSPDKETSVNVRTESKQVIIGLKNQNEAKVLKELTDSLLNLLALYSRPCNLEQCAEIGRRHCFLVDEDSKECTEGKSHAKQIMSLLKEKDLLNAKDELLPLSGQLWHNWCKKDKELTRLQNKMNQSIEQHCSNIEAEKSIIRKKQLEKASQNEFMQVFIKQLKSLPKTTKLFFLQWLKIYMDDLSCDRVVDLRDQYNRLWGQLQSEQMEDKHLNRIQEKLESLSDKMNACMFGLEHVLREVGQTYEALYDLQYQSDCFYELPKIAADMMLSGFPIELMDGDACYVPLKWIKAVLGELNKIIGDKKLFVLSVLGVQSSGKSTLLNTMFGLQFAVSAGRCTRGAFMQLIELSDELKKDLDTDYVLVMDTEGLRAMELSSKATLNHDNELATFVIGVGNMTMINVFGENPSEIKDILQISVQAFLRMKQVKLSSSCLFVHQNVGDLMAKDKNMEGRRNLQKELDKMTFLAAEQEQCNIQRFSEVIRFDAKTHIYYFAHLWEGNPPMAPPNPHYSEDTQKVKEMILSKQKGTHGILNISKLIVLIEDLWSALRNENFVFSFKNTLEISAYSKVENRYRNLTWQLRYSFLDLQAKLNNKIKKGEISSVSQNDVEKEVTKTFDSVREEFERFFQEDSDKEILIQWKANTENRLNCLHTELVEETKRQAMEHIRLKKSQRQVKQRQTGYEEALFKKSKQLALDIKDEGLDDSQLCNHFNILWQEWVAEINATAPCIEKPKIIAEAEDVLLVNFKHQRSMKDKLNSFSEWTSFCVDLSRHAARKKFLSWPLGESDKKQITHIFNNLVEDVQDYLVRKMKERVDYNKMYFHEIINVVSNSVNTIDLDSSYHFKLTNVFKFEVCLHLFGLAVPKFKAMHEAFQRANNPIVTLENKRQDFFNCFKISCQGAASVKTFSDSLCYKILEAVRPALYNKMSLAIVDEMTRNFPAFNGNRSKLENYILIDLAEQEDFEQYRDYIHFPKKYFKNFIEKCVTAYCLGKDSPRIKNFLQISLDYFQKKVLESIIESTKIENKCSNVSSWLDVFYERIEDLVSFSRADLKGIEHQEINDFQFFQEVMCTAWDTAIESFKKGFATVNFDSFEKKPHDILIDQLCGCWEQCPFCSAICTNTIPGHDGDHSVPFHRSQAINGMPWMDSNEFVTEICSSLVSSNSCLVVDRANQIPYKHYRKLGPNYANWSITPDTSSQPYWKWYVCKFRSNLEDDYGLKFECRGKIPPQWETITKEDVIASLKNL